MSLISRKSRYALHGLGYVASFTPERTVSFKEIHRYLRTYAPDLSLSPTYIARIFQDVSRAGFLTGGTGRFGGYRLTRPAKQVRVLEVVEALDGPILTHCCLMAIRECPRQKACGFRKTVHEAELAFYRRLQRETLASMARRMDFSPRRRRQPRKA